MATQPLVVPEKIIQPNEVATTTLELITGKAKGVARPGGIFTKEDLINIKLYVKDGLALAKNQAEVERDIGYKTSGIAGLEPADILALFDQIRNHALGWDGVEQKVIGQSIDLKGFSGRFVATGGELLDNIKEMPIMERVKKTLGDVSKLEGLKYESDDGVVALALGEILEGMRQDVNRQQGKTLVVKNAVSDFRVTLVGGKLTGGFETPGLEPQVANKHKAMVQNKLAETIKADEATLEEKQGKIEQLKKDYDKFVGLAFTGAAGGVIGLAITGGIFGAKAEAARKEKNELIEEVRQLQAKVTGAKALQKAIENLADHFSSIGTRMLDAETALVHLEYMWASILKLIEDSQEQWKSIDNGMKLTTFVTNFKNVINPWRTVGDLSGQLMTVITDALEEYKTKYEKVSA